MDFAIDLTELAEKGKLDPVIGRDDDIRRMIHILCRRTKNNPVLIGEPGIGKTALVEGLAQRIVRKDVPEVLQARIFSIDLGGMVAGTCYRGDFEERVKNLISEVERRNNRGEPVILFIDEVHLLNAYVGGMNAGNLFKPMLARGGIRCIGATTLNEYRTSIEKDAALERRFGQVILQEPSVNDTIAILRGLREKYEAHHGMRILDAALVQAATLAHRYMTQRRLPDSAIDLLDEACASIKVARETTPEDVEKLARRKFELEVEIRALEKEKDVEGSEQSQRLKVAREELEEVKEKLAPLKSAFKEKRIKTYDCGSEEADR
jgi:ATP-dependent Clp protease ATP-binding subunit ClpA